jgi:hypothetical protein
LGDELNPVAGFDSMQALVLALKYLIASAERQSKNHHCRLVWPGTKITFQVSEVIFPHGLAANPTNA